MLTPTYIPLVDMRECHNEAYTQRPFPNALPAEKPEPLNQGWHKYRRYDDGDSEINHHNNREILQVVP